MPSSSATLYGSRVSHFLIKVIVRCKRCEWRVFDKITMTTGNIEIKCPKCGYINEIDLSLRKGSVKFRKFKINTD